MCILIRYHAFLYKHKNMIIFSHCIQSMSKLVKMICIYSHFQWTLLIQWVWRFKSLCRFANVSPFIHFKVNDRFRYFLTPSPKDLVYLFLYLIPVCINFVTSSILMFYVEITEDDDSFIIKYLNEKKINYPN